MTSPRIFVMATLGTALLLTSCLSDGQTMRAPTAEQVAAISPATTLLAAIDEGGDQSGAMSLTAPWLNGSPTPVRYTCDGESAAPPLIWSPGPLNTKAYGIVLRDNDAPDAIHWTVTNIGSGHMSMSENSLPQGAYTAVNSFGNATYGPPCPPKGSTHSYTLTVYALDSVIAVTSGSTAEHVIADMDASVLEVATTEFTYSR